MAQTLYRLPTLYNIQGSNDKAIESYERSSKIAGECGDRVTQVKALNSLGKLYRRTRQPSKAMAIYQKALPIAKKHRNHLGLAHILGGMAAIHAHQGEYDKAVPYLKECSDIAKKIRSVEMEQWTLHDLGIAYERAGKTTKAIESYERSLELSRKQKNAKKLNLLVLLSRLARLNSKSSNYEKAADYCMEALEWAKKAGAKDGENRIMESLKMVYQAWKLEKNTDNEGLSRIEAVINKQVEREDLNEQLLKAVENIDIAKAKALLAKGANVKATDCSSRRALAWQGGKKSQKSSDFSKLMMRN
jgi:tetratricopeptide (TPR) repeat protein